MTYEEACRTWHQKRFPRMHIPVWPRVLRAAAFASGAAAACVGLLALGAWLDA